jgi:phenylpyruvate tautomerase PptA (4-oxalocrotonate tautomerase family)
MPVVTITMYKGRSVEEKKKICHSIQKIIKDTFSITHDNFHHRINEYDDFDMFVPPVSSKNYISLEFEFMPDRSTEEKNELYTNIAGGLKNYNINMEDILMIIREPALENWYIRGKTGEEIKSKK